jgi:hypothetical protein
MATVLEKRITKDNVTLDYLKEHLEFFPETPSSKFAPDGSAYLMHSFSSKRYVIHVPKKINCELLWLAWYFHTGSKPGDDEIVVPIDFDFTNTKPANLRVILKTEYSLFRRTRGYTINPLPKGIDRLPNGLYSASINCRGLTVQLGSFTTVEEAEADQKSMFKEYVRTGIVPVSGIRLSGSN